tara:strand:- start:353 stop:580 length:228 start_codon:yes stop_codon:yes gene_type:complete
MKYQGEFEDWVVENKLDVLLQPKEVKIFKEHNLGYKDLKLFGLTKRVTELLLYDWTIYRRRGGMKGGKEILRMYK